MSIYIFTSAYIDQHIWLRSCHAGVSVSQISSEQTELNGTGFRLMSYSQERLPSAGRGHGKMPLSD